MRRRAAVVPLQPRLASVPVPRVTSSAILDEFAHQVLVNEGRLVESRFRILLRPKPRWMPRRVWRALVRRLVYLERRG